MSIHRFTTRIRYLWRKAKNFPYLALDYSETLPCRDCGCTPQAPDSERGSPVCSRVQRKGHCHSAPLPVFLVQHELRGYRLTLTSAVRAY